MQIIGKTSEIKLAENLPPEVKADIVQTLYILDSAYGKDRNIIKDMGGFCCIISNAEDIKLLLDNWHIDIVNDISEVTVNIDGYIKKLFIVSSDYAIVTFIKSNLID